MATHEGQPSRSLGAERSVFGGRHDLEADTKGAACCNGAAPIDLSTDLFFHPIREIKFYKDSFREDDKTHPWIVDFHQRLLTQPRFSPTIRPCPKNLLPSSNVVPAVF
jgi:hypothetical protein